MVTSDVSDWDKKTSPFSDFLFFPLKKPRKTHSETLIALKYAFFGVITRGVVVGRGICQC